MEITFLELDEADVEKIYESYRLAEEPDAPVISFGQLTPEEIRMLTKGYQRFFRIAICGGIKVGWISVIDRKDDPNINLGFGLFQEFRGKGLMSKIVRQAAGEILSNAPGKKLTAGARVENLAAIKTLENSGFVQIGTAVYPPMGKWKDQIIYSRHVYAL